MHQIQRALFDLRRGVSLIIDDGPGAAPSSVLVRAVESEDGREPAPANASLVLDRQRLASIGVKIDSEAAALPLAQAGSAPLTTRVLLEAASGRRPLDPRQFGDPRPASTAERAALALMRRALLLPAAVTVALDPAQRAQLDPALQQGELLAVPAEAALRCADQPGGGLKRISEARVPLDGAPESRFVLFREADGWREHIAVLIGDRERWPRDVPVRLHSSCLTGDLFGSLRCDCGEQLRFGVRNIHDMGGGVLLYLAQEGRGIGLANKLRAYTLQDQGLDTVEADAVLGFGDDERRYGMAVEMLAELGIRRIRLLTNNPAKINALIDGGIEVSGREKLYGRVTDENRRYLAAKAARSGHWLDEALLTQDQPLG